MEKTANQQQPQRVMQWAASTSPSQAKTGSAQNPSKEPEKNTLQYQVEYVPLARDLPTSNALIASSLAAATKEALQVFEAKYGNPTDYLLNILGVSLEDLKTMISAEQADAVALASIASLEDGGEFILGDVTGFGKGRTLAILAVIAIQQGKKVVFVTDKPNLFSDWWRDIKDIHAEELVGEPIILNNGPNGKIVDMTTSTKNGRAKVLFKHDQALMADLTEQIKYDENGEYTALPSWPEDRNVMMVSYSQFRSMDKKKLGVFVGLARNAAQLYDESQNAVRTSNISYAVKMTRKQAAAIVSSSATPGRTINEMMLYKKVMPWLPTLQEFSGHDLTTLNLANRTALAEASAVRAAKEGKYIARQHDMSKMVMGLIDVADSNPLIEEHEEAFSSAARCLAQIWGITNAEANLVKVNTPSAKGVLTQNFGAAYSLLNKAFSVAMRLDKAVECAIASSLKGEKYIGIMNGTQEATMRMIREILEERNSASDKEDTSIIHERISKQPDFRDLIYLVAFRLTKITTKFYKDSGLEDEISYADNARIKEVFAKLDEVLKTFPSLPVSPLDYLKSRIESESEKLFNEGKLPEIIRVGEISGRSLGVNDEGSIVNFDAGDRNDTIYGFNYGGPKKVGALLVTVAGAVGISLHDAANFHQHGVRHAQEIEPIPNVTLRIQMWGRFMRRGQISDPKFSMLGSSMPGDIYNLVSQAKKISEVSALISGSSKSIRMVQSVPDPIDAAGDKAAKALLRKNEHVRQKLMISVDEDVSDEDDTEAGVEFGTVLAFLRRIRLLAPVAAQRNHFEAFLRKRAEILESYPEEPSVMTGNWRTIGCEPLDAIDEQSNSLKLLRIESEKTTIPLNSKRINAMIEASAADNVLDCIKLVHEQGQAYLTERLAEFGIQYRKEDAVREGTHANTYRKEVVALIDLLKSIKSRSFLSIPGDNDKEQVVVVTGILCHYQRHACNPRSYDIEFVCPGDDLPRHITLEPFIKEPEKYKPYNMKLGFDAAMARFDASLANKKTVARYIVSGDPIAEVEFSLRLRGGTRVTYQSGDEWRHGLLVPKSLERRVKKTPIRLHSAEMALKYLMSSIDSIKTDSMHASRGILINYKRHRMSNKGTFIIRLDDKTDENSLFKFHKICQHVGITTSFLRAGRDNGAIVGVAINNENDMLKLLDAVLQKTEIPLFISDNDRSFVFEGAPPAHPSIQPEPQTHSLDFH